MNNWNSFLSSSLLWKQFGKSGEKEKGGEGELVTPLATKDVDMNRFSVSFSFKFFLYIHL